MPDNDLTSIHLVVFLTLSLAVILISTPPAIAEQSGWDAAYGNDTPANVPEWVPPTPPAGTELTTEEYIMMWNGMETIPGNATDAFGENYSKTEALKVIAARRDAPRPKPPDTQVTWNQNSPATLASTPPTRSRYPTGTSLRDTTFFRDAYLRIGAVTPSTIYHTNSAKPLGTDHFQYVKTGGETRHLAPEDGGVLVASDYRVEPPNESLTLSDVDTGSDVVDVRLKFELQNTSQDTIAVFAADPRRRDNPSNITDSTTNATGGTLVTYEDLRPQTGNGRVAILVKQNFSVAFLEMEQHLTCEDPDNQTNCEWVTVETTIRTENITVTDSRVLTRRTTPVTIKYRPGTDYTYLQLENTPAWSAVTTGSGENASVYSGHYGFITKRNHHWDRFRTATAAKTSDPYNHPFTPVQTHALPAYNGSRVSTPPKHTDRITVISETVGAHKPPYPSQPYHVNVSTGTTPGYRPLESATLSITNPSDTPVVLTGTSSGSTGQLTVEPYVYGADLRQRPVKYPPTQTAHLNLTATPVFADENAAQPEYFDITVLLTDASGDPIRTAGTNRTIRLSGGHTIETNASGIATYHGSPANYSQTGIIAWFEPQAPFEGRHHYRPARAGDTAPYPLQYIKHALGASVKSFAMILFGILPLVAIILITYTAITGESPW